MTERRLSKKTSVILVTAILLGTAGLATAAATDVDDTLLPMIQGKFHAFERGLSRHSAALAVHVAQFDGENRTPLEGATVSVYRLPHGDSDGPPGMTDRPTDRMPPQDAPPAYANATPVATEQTDADGRAVFELRPGRYVVAVQYEDMAGRHPIAVGKDTRLGVVFDQDGQAHFFPHHRTDIADRGEPHTLHVRVGERTGDAGGPIANATVKILKPVRDGNGDMTLETVAEGLTDARGGITFDLYSGGYILDVQTPDGETGEKPIRLRGDTGYFVIFDEDGEAHFRELSRHDRFDRPPMMDRPTDRPMDKPHDRPTDRRPADHPTDRPSDRPTDRPDHDA